MKRVLMLNYEFPPLGGGAGNATFYLLKEMAKRDDVTIDLVTSSVDGFRVDKFAPNVTIHYLDIGKNGNLHYQSMRDLLAYSWKAYWYSRRLVRTTKFDLCHAFFGIPCGFVAMKLGLPYVVSLRGSDVPFHNKKFHWLDKFVFRRLSRKIWRRAGRVVANSEKLRELALASAPEQAIDVITNGVDTNLFRPSPSWRGEAEAISSAVSSGSLRLVSCGRLSAIKGYDYLIKALTGIDNVELTLVGDGPQLDCLKELARSCKAKVNFLGKKSHEEIANQLRSVSIYVSSSVNEGMSNSVMEAMASGLPIIATDTGGTAELVEDGVSGLVVKKADAESLGGAIRKLAANPALIVAMGAASRRRAEKMSWAVAAGAYLRLYFFCGAAAQSQP